MTDYIKSKQSNNLFKGYLLSAYKSIITNAKAHKTTRNILVYYLLILVIAPPTIVLSSFLAAPVATARFFGFSITPSILLADYDGSVLDGGDVLGESTSVSSPRSPVFTYVSTILGRQAEGIVKVLRDVSPTVVSGIVLPLELGQDPHVIMASDSAGPEAGYAIIKSGTNMVNVEFVKQYSKPPVVSVSNNLEGLASPDLVPKYGVYHVTSEGFTIKTAPALTTTDLTFSWIALPSTSL